MTDTENAATSAGAEDTQSNENKEATKKEEKSITYKHQKKDFELGRILGDGAFAKVVEGKVINEESPYFEKEFAVKVMDKRHIYKNDKVKYVKIEQKVFILTDAHPFVCHMHFSFQDPYTLYMVLDLCTEGELSYLIWKYHKLEESITRVYMSEIISALEYMHSLGIYHRDLKPENVLIHADGHIRLTDFGTAKYVDPNDEKAIAEAERQQRGTVTQPINETEEQPQTHIDVEEELRKRKEQSERKGSFVGTALYVPPEVVADKPYSFAGMDFWAMGCIIYQCLTGTPPFTAAHEYLIFKKIENHEYELPDDLTPPAKQIIEGFLTPEIKSRLGMKGYDEIKETDFFNGIDWDWEQMRQVPVPKLPTTPKDSPAKDGRKFRSESKYDDLSDLTGAQAIQPVDAAKHMAIAETKTDTPAPDENEELYGRWKDLLSDGESIRFGSQVELSKMWGFSTQSLVMLFTANNRILLIDHAKMRIKQQILKVHIVAVNVTDKQQFVIRTHKKSFKLKAIGATSQRWKEALENTG